MHTAVGFHLLVRVYRRLGMILAYIRCHSFPITPHHNSTMPSNELEHEHLLPDSIGIHGDESLNRTTDVMAPIHVSSTFRYPEENLEEYSPDITSDDCNYYYRFGNNVTRRVEAVLGGILGGKAVVFGSGLSAFHAAMLYYNPKRVFAADVYHGCVSIMKLWQRNFGRCEKFDLDEQVIKANIQAGDAIHVETPINPYGTSFDLAKFAKLAHDNNAFLLVDATLAPPPLQQPFDFGADMVLHSATKYLGGHSDLLAGVLVTRDDEVKKQLLEDRSVMGSISGSLESWLLLRSLRTFNMRFNTQTANASAIVKFLTGNIDRLSKLKKVYHTTLQEDEFISKQMPHGGNTPLFSIEVTDGETAKDITSKLKLFTHATSLGGVESLVEWRILSDKRCPDTILRLSIGCENSQDLIKDLENVLK